MLGREGAMKCPFFFFLGTERDKQTPCFFCVLFSLSFVSEHGGCVFVYVCVLSTSAIATIVLLIMGCE